MVGLRPWIAHKLFGHQPPKEYQLAWDYHAGFWTTCRFCHQKIDRDYNGKWNLVQQPND